MIDTTKYLPSWGSLQKIVRIVGISSGIFLASCAVEVTSQTYKDLTHLTEPAQPTEEEILTSYQKMRNSKLPTEIAKLQAVEIIAAADKAGIDYVLLVGMIETESLFDATATSSIGAKGLMQVYRGETKIDQGQAYDLRYNIDMGITILQEKLNGKTLTEALNAYSGGAAEYSDKVYMNLGRYVMHRSSSTKIDL